MEIKLYAALKLKNTLAGEIRKLEQLIQSKNSHSTGDVLKHNLREKIQELENKRYELIKLKTAITLANVSIASKIYELAELKAEHKFWTSLNTREGSVKDYRDVVTTYNVIVDELEVENTLARLKSKIDSIQDDLDQYNHVRVISI